MKMKGETYWPCDRYHFRDSREEDLDAHGRPFKYTTMVVVDLKPLPRDERGRVTWEAVKAAPQAFYLFTTRSNMGYAIKVRKSRSHQFLGWKWNEAEKKYVHDNVEPGEHYIECRMFAAKDGRLYSTTKRWTPTPEKLRYWLECEAKLKAAKAAKSLNIPKEEASGEEAATA